jgi:hypothetical protein
VLLNNRANFVVHGNKDLWALIMQQRCLSKQSDAYSFSNYLERKRNGYWVGTQ